MFKLEGSLMTVVLPEGKTQFELITDCKAEIRALIAGGNFYGKELKING